MNRAQRMIFSMAPDPNGEREKAKKLIEMCGGTFVKNTLRKPPGTIELASTTSQKILESQPPKSRSKNKVYSVAYVYECARKNEVVDLEPFVIVPLPNSLRKRTRGKVWTEEEDITLGLRLGEARGHLGNDAPVADLFRWVVMNKPMAERDLESMKNRFKNKAANKARDSFANWQPGQTSGLATAAVEAEDETLDDFDREMLLFSEEAQAEDSVVLLEEESLSLLENQQLHAKRPAPQSSADPDDNPNPQKKARQELPKAAPMPVADSQKRTTFSGALKKKKVAEVIHSDDLAVLKKVVADLVRRSEKTPREVIYSIFRHSGWVNRAALSLVDPSAEEDEDGESHDAIYGETLSAERLKFLSGIP